MLGIDTAGLACAAAVAAGEEVLAVRSVVMVHGQAEALLPLVDNTVREAGLTPAALELLAVTTGPGSFTGIRVGLAAAHGIALAGGLTVFGVTSFEAVAETVSKAALGRRCLLVALESRRAEFFVQLFDQARSALSHPAACLPENLGAVVARSSGSAVAIAGDAAARAVAALSRADADLIEPGAPPVTGALRVALRQWRHGIRPAPARPLYLRPPDVTLPAGQTATEAR